MVQQKIEVLFWIGAYEKQLVICYPESLNYIQCYILRVWDDSIIVSTPKLSAQINEK